MSVKANFKSDAFEAIHSSAQALFRVGAMEEATLRSFDEACLVAPQEIKPEQIKQIREQNHVSQPVFARFLNTSASTGCRRWPPSSRTDMSPKASFSAQAGAGRIVGRCRAPPKAWVNSALRTSPGAQAL